MTNSKITNVPHFLLLAFIAEQTLYIINFGQFGTAVLAMYPPKTLPIPLPTGGHGEHWKDSTVQPKHWL